MSIQFIYELTDIDPWFLYQIKQIVELEQEIAAGGNRAGEPLFKKAKSWGFSDIQLAYLTGTAEDEIKKSRQILGIHPVYKLVDTCAAEFKAATPYFYSTYETENEARVSDQKKSYDFRRRTQPDRPGH